MPEVTDSHVLNCWSDALAHNRPGYNPTNVRGVSFLKYRAVPRGVVHRAVLYNTVLYPTVPYRVAPYRTVP